MINSTFAAYIFTFTDNTQEQCIITNKQITDGNASFTPSDDQTINTGGTQSFQVNLLTLFAT